MTAQSIYRILPFSRFQEIVETHSLSFVTFDMWPQDPYEGFLFRMIESEKGRHFIRLFIRDCLPEFPLAEFADGPGIIFKMMNRYRKTIHLQCWTETPESDLMWSRYAAGNTAVRIECSIDNINKIEGIKALPISYKDKIHPEEELFKFLPGRKMEFPKLFETKRAAFKDEHEIRLMTDIDTNFMIDEPRDDKRDSLRIQGLYAFHKSGQLTNDELKTALEKYDPSTKNVKKILFSNIPDFIKSVLVHPDADKLLVNAVEKYCAVHEIKFIGKSQLRIFDF